MLKKGIMKCFEAYLYDDNGDVLAVDENLTSASLSQACEEAEIKNGKDNATWATIQSSKTLTAELQTNVLDINKLVVQAGSSIVKGATKMHTNAVVLELEDDTATLPQAPLSNDEVKIIDVAADKVLTMGALESGDYTISSTTVTFNSGKKPTGEIKVLPYAYNAVNGEEIVIASDKFPAVCKLLLKSIYIDEDQNITHDVEVEMKVKPSADWTLSTQADFGQGMDNTLTLKAQKDSKGNLGYIRFLKRA